MKYLALLVEGLRVFWDFRRRGWWKSWPPLPLPPYEYVMWRLGTVYGTFQDRDLNRPKTLRMLLQELWRDRENIWRYLHWSRNLRHHRRRKR